MLELREQFVQNHDIKFNPLKLKVVCYNVNNIQHIIVHVHVVTK